MINFIREDLTQQDETNEEAHRARSGRVRNAQLLCPLLMEPGHVTTLTHQCDHRLGSSTKLCVQSCYWSLITQARLIKLVAGD